MARTTIVPKWLKSSHVSGLDQLGIQVISIALYGDLLPGLTNVTDRIRYYSFYPWILHRYASDVGKFDETTWQDHLRRAEFLLALVGRVHHQEEGEGGEAIVGAERATKVLAEIQAKPKKTWRLSTWAAVADADKPGSYFKNKSGGFAQYYRGQLSSLGLIRPSDEPPGVKLAKGRGTGIANICNSQKGRTGFWKAVLKDEVTLEQLTEWGNCLCPCAVDRYEDERRFLVDLLFGPDTPGSTTSTSRARSLRLLLTVLNKADMQNDPVGSFRNLTYYEHDVNKRQFRPPAELADVFRKWMIYEAGEFVHYALEVAFDALLRHLAEVDIAESEASQFILNTAQVALEANSTTLGLGKGKAKWGNRTVGDLVEEARSHQKPLAEWEDDPWSENNLIDDLDDEPLIRLARAFACLISTYARGRVSPQPFRPFSTISPEWLERHRVTLPAVFKYFTDGMQRDAAEVLGELLKECVVGQHLRVAMRKLRYDSQATFKFSIEEGRFIWLENFEPTFTNPRLKPAFRFLRDLGLCSGESGGWKLTSSGKDQLRQSHGD